MSFFRSLYGRVSALALLLALILCASGAWVAVWHVNRFVKEVDQKLHRNLAMKLAASVDSLLAAGAYEVALGQADMHTTMFFPALETYILDDSGRILARMPAADSLQLTHVDLTPVHALQDEAVLLPVWGQNPVDPSEPKVFSAAPATLAGGAPGYLYVVLRGQAAGSAAGMLQNSYILRTLPLYLGLILLCTVLVGWVGFRLLSARFRRLIASVHQFKQGHYDHRVDVQGQDEIGDLARAFNEMAATIEAQVDALRQSDAERRAVVANISHDFRTPLTAVRGRAERLLQHQGGMPAEAQRANLEEILRSTDRLERLAQHLNALSKLDARSLQPRMEPFPIAELVQDIVVSLRPVADDWGVALRTEVDPTVGHVRADISLIERLLTNLVSNALENTPQGGRVTVRVQPGAAETVRLAVEDTGRGIPADALVLVRQRFYRVKRPALHRSDGSGLGLSIAHEIAELHGADLEIDSSEGAGTRVRCTLPAAADVAAVRAEPRPMLSA